MSRPRTKSFTFGKDIYYFTIKSGSNSGITIKRKDQQKAIDAFKMYQKTHKTSAEWLGRWDGKKFVEDKFEELAGK